MQEIVIPLSKKKIKFLFFSSVFFVALGFFLIYIAETQHRYPPSLVKIVGVSAVAFFGLSGIYVFVKFFDNRPGLVINNEGIVDNSSGVSAGLIKWENITDIHLTDIRLPRGRVMKMLTIEIDNAKEILARVSAVKKLMMGLNKAFYKSPVQITDSALNCDLQELCGKLKAQLASRRGK